MSTPISRRANFLAALAHKTTAYMPAVFITDNLSRPLPLPPGMGDDYFDLNIMRFLGGDVLHRVGIGGVVDRRAHNYEVQTTTHPDGSQEYCWPTPAGVLRKTTVPTEEGRVNFAAEMPLKRIEDYRALKCILEDSYPAVHAEAIAAGRAALAAVGDDGITYTIAPESPVMELARQWAGLERLVYDLWDYPAVVEEVMALIHALNCRHYELLCQNTPGRVIVCWDDVTNQYLTRKLFRQYWLPAIRDYAAICHRYDKLYVVHACGKLQGLYDLLPETGIDAFDWLTPPPSGDVTWAEAQRAWGGQLTVLGANPAQGTANATPDEAEARVHQWLDGVDTHRGFVYMVLCPWGTPLPVAARIVKVLARDYGLPLNTAPGYPPLWEYPAARW